jgi:hypothetical protein
VAGLEASAQLTATHSFSISIFTIIHTTFGKELVVWIVKEKGKGMTSFLLKLRKEKEANLKIS